MYHNIIQYTENYIISVNYIYSLSETLQVVNAYTINNITIKVNDY